MKTKIIKNIRNKKLAELTLNVDKILKSKVLKKIQQQENKITKNIFNKVKG